jgi:hypothetical protein
MDKDDVRGEEAQPNIIRTLQEEGIGVGCMCNGTGEVDQLVVVQNKAMAGGSNGQEDSWNQQRTWQWNGFNIHGRMQHSESIDQ